MKNHTVDDPEQIRETEIISSLLKVIDDVCNCISFEINSDMTLDYDDVEKFSDFKDENTASENEKLDPSFSETAEAEKPPITLNFSFDYMKKIIDYYDERDSKGKRKHSWKSTQHRFKCIRPLQYLAHFRHYIEQGGRKRERMKVIDDFVYDKFEEARDALLSVQDWDLKRWSLPKATENSVITFQASEYWLPVFKDRYRICSRKIKKLVTRHHAENSDVIIASADSFLADVKREMKDYSPEEILNTDQVDLELELHSTRTLSHEDENVTFVGVKSKNATTHSYTTQPMISLAGKLVGPVFLCLKESKGKISQSKLTDYMFLVQ